MAENVTIARPYAEAAFQLAKEAGSLNNWADALGHMAAAAADPHPVAVAAAPRPAGPAEVDPSRVRLLNVHNKLVSVYVME